MSILPYRLLAALALLAGLIAAPCSAIAGQSYDNCTGFIDSLPATISTQGVWCLDKSLSTGVTSGAAITIAANNVTIDCNDFKLGGLAAGDGSEAVGILAYKRQNATVRHCNIRGFHIGLFLNAGAGHLVEDNRLDNNLYIGILLGLGDNSLVQRNRVYDTGGRSGFNSAFGIVATADVIDNTVAGVFATATNTSSTGIELSGTGNVTRNNRVRGLQASGSGSAKGIKVIGAANAVDGNQVVASAGTAGTGIEGYGATVTACSNNVIGGFNTAMTQCHDAGSNTSL